MSARKPKPKAHANGKAKARSTSRKEVQTRDHDLIKFVENLKKQWMATIDALVDPLMMINKDYTIAKANLAFAQVTKKDIKALIGKRCYEVFAERKTPCTGCKMLSAATEKTPHQFELDGFRGNSFYEVTSQPILNGDGTLDGVVHIYRDRTEAKQLREQLLQSEKLSSIGLLAGGVAHEINNPLGGILVFSQMLLRELSQDSPHYTDVKEILHAAERCKAIVESLLDFARTNPAHKKPELEPVSAQDAAKTALRFGKVAIPRHLVDITEEWLDEDKPVLGDRNKLIQLFLNLIQNAVQAMPDGGTLTLRSATYKDKEGQQFVDVEVIDTGVGIPEEHRKKIFDPFFTTKDPGEGTGLGLAICYGIVKELGGELTVHSKVNNGSCFRVRIPVAQQTIQTKMKSA